MAESAPVTRGRPGLTPRHGRRLARRALAAAAWLLVLGAPGARAKEADSFTDRYEALAFPAGEVRGRPLTDFTDQLDAEVQRIFAEVLGELEAENRRMGGSCHSPQAPRRLFRRLRNALGGPLLLTRNRLRPVINRQPNHFKTGLADSIYRDFSPWQSISLGLLGRLADNRLAEILRFDLRQVLVEGGRGSVAVAEGWARVLGPDGAWMDGAYRLRDAEPAVVADGPRTYYLLDSGQALLESSGTVHRVVPILVSSDKFSHFFNRGLGLFKRLGTGGDDELERVLEFNQWLEDSLWGSKSTGVAAYGDLVANFQGMRFWVHLLGESLDGYPLADPMGVDAAPYVRCSVDGNWVQTRRIAIQDYLDPAWDEALNCSRLRTPALLEKVSLRIEQLGRRDGGARAYECPVDAELIGETARRYGRFAPRVINAGGHSSLRSGSAD